MEGHSSNYYPLSHKTFLNKLSKLFQENCSHLIAGLADASSYNDHFIGESATGAYYVSDGPVFSTKIQSESKTATGQSGKHNVPSSLAGTWKNELQSTMVIYPTSDVKGQFNGRYRTIVGNASNYYDLVGRYDIDGDDTHGTLGWTVNWNNESHGNSKSTTTWSGQRFVISSQKKIVTTWLLTSETGIANSWSSTRVGKDTFLKTGD